MAPTVQVTQLDIPEGMIDLGVGQPDPALLPLAAMRQALAHRAADGDPLPWLAYGVEQGNGHFRVALAELLTRHYRHAVHPNGLFVTNGSSQGLAHVCARFTRPGDTVLVEDPSYFLALRIFADHGLRVVGVPTDEGGLCIDGLHAALVEHRPRLIYTIPTFHNPTAVTLSAERRAALVELAVRHDALVVADEVYQMLHFGDEAPPPPLAAWVDTEAVISLGTFSKILAPGLRLGWLQAGPEAMARLVHSGLLDSGGGLNPFTSSMVHSAIELGLQDRQLEHLRAAYRMRATALDEALHRHLPAGATFTSPRGGFFTWLRLPDGIDATVLRPIAREHGVSFQPGPVFSCRGGWRTHARLCFAYYDEQRLDQGVERLARALAAAR